MLNSLSFYSMMNKAGNFRLAFVWTESLSQMLSSSTIIIVFYAFSITFLFLLALNFRSDVSLCFFKSLKVTAGQSQLRLTNMIMLKIVHDRQQTISHIQLVFKTI